MFRSMFARLFSVFLMLMLVLITIWAALSYVTIRDDRINARMEELKSQARDMAYLAGQVQISSLDRYFGVDSTAEQYMQWKAQKVYDEFGALIVVVDRWGHVQQYNLLPEDNTDITQTLSGAVVEEALSQALSGKGRSAVF
jgi:hypothetical protein